MKKQPDFSKIFFDYFGIKPHKVLYEVREEPNLLHDIVFLGSLIHDAEFKRKEVQLRGNKIIFPIKRDCFEFNNLNVAEKLIYETNSLLAISPVDNVIWEFNNEVDFRNDKIIYLHHLYVDFLSHRRLGDKINIIFDGGYWKCRITILTNKFKITLKDLEMPSLKK
jgi:hypothetical protein